MGLSLGELAAHLGAELDGDPEGVVERVDTLPRAEPGAVSFLANRRYSRYLPNTCASAVILTAADREACPVASLVMDNPYLGYARAAALLNPSAEQAGGIHPKAWVSDGAQVDPSAWIGPQAVVESGAKVGAGSYLGPGCVLERDVVIGQGTRLVANVTICKGVAIGDRGLIHPGVVVGADGFGIANDQGVWVKVPQLGSVHIGDDVEIGANTAIDRGALEDTVIENGVKLDNLVQVGHNVHIGEHTAVAGCAAIAGSVRIGKRCTVGGMAAIAGHLEIVDDVHLTGTSAVPRSIPEPGIYSSGMPIQENKAWRRTIARLLKLDELARRVKELESQQDD